MAPDVGIQRRHSVWREPGEVAARLAELGLTIEDLDQSIRVGQLAQDLCTDNHPSNYPGSAAYGETNAELRRRLCLRGWSRDNRFGICRAVAPDGSFSITAITGDGNTADPTHSPMTRRPRGNKAQEAVTHNGTMCLFPDEVMQALVHAGELPPIMWYLLYHRQRHQVYAELSIPTATDSNGIIESWQERIILPISDIGTNPDPRQTDLEGTDVEVDVRRKA